MNSIHKQLSKQYPWYNNWHKNPDYGVWHWVILISIAITFTILVTNADNSYVYAGTTSVTPPSSTLTKTPPPPPPPPGPTPTPPPTTPPPTSGFGHILLAPTALAFSATSGGSTPGAKTDTLTNTGNAILDWTGSTNQNWCHVTPGTGTLAAVLGKTKYSAVLSISVDAPSNIGTFTCLVSISGSADNSPQIITTTYTVSGSGTPPPPPPPPSSGGGKTPGVGIQVNVGDLAMFFRGNPPTNLVPRSGFSNLFNTVDAPSFMPFLNNDSAGMNFEHIISGLNTPNNSFTPRAGPFPATQLADGTVRLTRQAADEPWKIASTLDYKVVAPHYVDVTYRATYQDPSLFAPYNWTSFFFNQYMAPMPDISMHFLGVSGPGQPETWLQADAPEPTSSPEANYWDQGGNYRSQYAADGQLPWDPNNSAIFNIWAYNYPRYTKPFYYGLTQNGMVYEIMFDRTVTATDEIRFTIFKFFVRNGGGPAYDYEYIVRNPHVGQTYGYKARVVYKKFVSPEDCLNEYTTWAASLQ